MYACCFVHVGFKIDTRLCYGTFVWCILFLFMLCLSLSDCYLIFYYLKLHLHLSIRINTVIVNCLLCLLFNCVSVANNLPQELFCFGSQSLKGFGENFMCHPWFLSGHPSVPSAGDLRDLRVHFLVFRTHCEDFDLSMYKRIMCFTIHTQTLGSARRKGGFNFT